jgi:hypothetical protein
VLRNGANSSHLGCPGSRLRRSAGKFPDVIAGAAVGQHHVDIAVRRLLVVQLGGSAGRRRMGGSRGTVLLVAVFGVAEEFLWSKRKTNEKKKKK